MEVKLTEDEVERILWARFTAAQRQAEQEYDATHTPTLRELRASWNAAYTETQKVSPQNAKARNDD